MGGNEYTKNVERSRWYRKKKRKREGGRPVLNIVQKAGLCQGSNVMNPREQSHY